MFHARGLLFFSDLKFAEAAPDPRQNFQSPGVFMSDGCITPDTPRRLWGTTQDFGGLIPGQDDLQCYTFAPKANARPRQNDLTTSFRSGKRFSAELIQHQLQLEQLLPV
jgi:hypothetical protein